MEGPLFYISFRLNRDSEATYPRIKSQNVWIKGLCIYDLAWRLKPANHINSNTHSTLLGLRLALNIVSLKGWRDGSEVKSTGCSSRGPEFNSQQPHGGSQPFVLRSGALLCQNVVYIIINK